MKNKTKLLSEVAVSSAPKLKSTRNSLFGAESKSFAAECRLYDSLKNSVPVIGGAVSKIVRLTGGFKVRCKNKNDEEKLSSFLNNVSVGGNMTGIDSFCSIFLNQLLTYGTAVGEIVPCKNLRSFTLFNGELSDVVFKRSSCDKMKIDIYTAANGTEQLIQNDSTILLSVLDPDAGQLSGNSLLKGLPFVSSVLLQIFETMGNNWERIGNLRYAVTYRPQNDAMDKAYAKERAMQIAEGWSSAMKTGGEVKDFISVGDVDIKVIGADNQIIDSEVPVRQMLEQILAKTGLPPFLLGLNWSTTERMAQQQTDMLTSELWHYRRIITPIILKICKTFLRMNSLCDECEVEWDEISLLDETENAKARYYNAQADKYLAEAENLGKEKTLDVE